jgi:hypothetical protein
MKNKTYSVVVIHILYQDNSTSWTLAIDSAKRIKPMVGTSVKITGKVASQMIKSLGLKGETYNHSKSVVTYYN